VSTRLYTPIPFGARFPASVLATAPGTTVDVPLTVLGSGGPRALHIVVSDSGGIVLAQPLTLDTTFTGTPASVNLHLTIPSPTLLPARAELTAVVSEPSSGTATNVSRMTVDISEYN
jgi:hypothetical protein